MSRFSIASQCDIPLRNLPQNLLSGCVRIAMESLDIDFRRFKALGYSENTPRRLQSCEEELNIGYPESVRFKSVLTSLTLAFTYNKWSRLVQNRQDVPGSVTVPYSPESLLLFPILRFPVDLRDKLDGKSIWMVKAPCR